MSDSTDMQFAELLDEADAKVETLSALLNEARRAVDRLATEEARAALAPINPGKPSTRWRDLLKAIDTALKS